MGRTEEPSELPSTAPEEGEPQVEEPLVVVPAQDGRWPGIRIAVHYSCHNCYPKRGGPTPGDPQDGKVRAQSDVWVRRLWLLLLLWLPLLFLLCLWVLSLS